MAWAFHTLFAQEPISQGIILRDLPLKRSVTALLEDHDGFIWIGTGEGLFRYDGFEVDPIGVQTGAPAELDQAPVRALLEDSHKNLWVASRNGLFVFNATRTSCVAVAADTMSRMLLRPSANLREINGRVWLFSESPQITVYAYPHDFNSAPLPDRVIEVPGELVVNGHALAGSRILLETEDRTRYMIIDTAGRMLKRETSRKTNATYFWHEPGRRMLAMASPELYAFDAETGAFHLEKSFASIFLKPIPSWMETSVRDPDKIWIGSTLGHLLSYSVGTGRYHDYTPSISTRLYEGRYVRINTIMEDNHGGLWLGTNQGLAYLRIPDQQYFVHLPSPATASSEVNFSTRGVCRLPDGSLFVASYAGLFRYFPEGPIREYKVWNDQERRAVDPTAYDFLPDGDKVWIASEGNGVLYYDIARDTILRTAPASSSVDTPDPNRNRSQFSFRIFRDAARRIWVGTSTGLFEFGRDMKMRRLPHLPETGEPMRKVYDIREGPDRTLWIAAASGLYSLSEDRQTLRHHALKGNPRIAVQCIRIDGRGKLWIGTRGYGLWTMDPATGDQVVLDTEDGLPDNTVCAIQETRDGFMWISTNNGLSRLDARLIQFTNFFIEDGLIDNEFNHASSYQDASGRLYFGGVSGMIYFDPRNALMKTETPVLRITKILEHDGENGRTITHLYNPGHQPDLRLGASDKYFTVFYSTNIPIPSARETFAYKLVGLHDEWQPNADQHSIQFTGLSPGRYTLQLRAMNQPPDDAGILQMPVFIARPGYLQWWAFPLYALLLGGTGFLVMRGIFRRKHVERQLQLETEHKTRLEEINRSKSTFFANITHEFKTPLTLIQGPAEEIARRATDPQVVKQANLIARNARSILGLVNQLLDLGKLEANLDEPKFYRLDLVASVRHWMEKFHPLARQKEIRLGFECDQPSLYVDFDPVKLETVVNNLLSNAVKFTPGPGRVKCAVRMDDDAPARVLIIVEDNGPGIPEDEQAFVFDRFYQGSHASTGGTGIGLAFVREMVRVHGGQVDLHSSPGTGARFTVSLPLFQEGAIEPGTPNDPMRRDVGERDGPPGSTLNSPDDKPVVLVVEDNPDVAMLVMDVLGGAHTMIHALNGRDGHAEAVRHVPDLIITDVMMPVMDGYTLTHLVRQDIHTAHIPVIMLTAKDGEASRIEGRAHGADVYLEKPFSIRELELTVRNLLLLKKRMAEQMAGRVTADAAGVEFASAADTSFYRQFLAVLEANIAESDLSVEDFTNRLGVSRTQLHRKLKAITGLSVNQVVRNVRLQRALVLLRDSGLSVSEVGYAVGFSSPSYFAERFREHYGYPPSEAARPGASRE